MAKPVPIQPSSYLVHFLVHSAGDGSSSSSSIRSVRLNLGSDSQQRYRAVRWGPVWFMFSELNLIFTICGRLLKVQAIPPAVVLLRPRCIQRGVLIGRWLFAKMEHHFLYTLVECMCRGKLGANLFSYFIICSEVKIGRLMVTEIFTLSPFVEDGNYPKIARYGEGEFPEQSQCS